MGSEFKKSVVAESVRKSLHGWRKRAKRSRQGNSLVSHEMEAPVTPLDSVVGEIDKGCNIASNRTPMNSFGSENGSSSRQSAAYVAGSEIYEQASSDEDSCASHGSEPLYDSHTDDEDAEHLFPQKEVFQDIGLH